MPTRTVSATEFKAKCLSLLDAVDKGETITVTKRGRAVATLQPIKNSEWKSPAGSWIGKVEIVGDLDAFETTHLWNALRKQRAK
jgi:prevent-host-death family protein